MTAIVTRGNALDLHLPDASVDLVVTSPPYFGLRSYQDGGSHYEGQVGDEATPTEYLDALIAATAEWMRVLKPGGSIWVNIGDAYSKGVRLDESAMTVEDAAWLAGVIDSDGSISVHKQGTSYTAWVRVGQMRPEVVQRIHKVTGLGTVCQDARGVWNWQAAAKQAAALLRQVWPWLHIKQRPALAAVELQERKAAVGGKGRWNALTDDELRHRERIRTAVLAWNRGDVDDYEPPLLPVPRLGDATWVQQKSLVGLPWRYAIRCIDELGLILRAEIVWSKPNGLPESVTDRVRRSHEQVFHFVKQPKYYTAVDEVREEHIAQDHHRNVKQYQMTHAPGQPAVKMDRTLRNPLGKLPGSVWTIPTAPLKVPDHLGIDFFAAYPPELVRRIVLGWSPREVCTACGEGRRPVADCTPMMWRESPTAAGRNAPGTSRKSASGTMLSPASRVITGYACACPDTTAPTTPGIVLDPFGGTGTSALVASAYGRVGISVDLSADYCRLAQWRTSDPGERARVLGVEKPPVQVDGQLVLFEGGAA